MEPICGSQYVAFGMRVFTIGCVGFPAMCVTATMPSIIAACASCGNPATMSPTAYKFGSAVSMNSFTCTNPRSTFALDFSSPQFSVIGLRPTASSSFSARSVCAFPSLSLNDTVTPLASFFTPSTVHPV